MSRTAIAGFTSIATLAALLASPARAQAIDYGALQDLFGEPVTNSATGSPQRVTEVPANMEIITADDIRRSGADNIPEILQFVAGVNVRRYGFADADVSVRGYNQQYSPRLLVLINGRQVYLDDYGRTPWQLLPVQISEIRQIEVVKGPNSALFGFNAVGGVINIITYDPLLDSTNALTARGGTQGYTSGSAVVTLHSGDKAGLRVSLGGFGAHEFSTKDLPALTGPYNTTPHQYALSADGRLQLASNIELTVEATAMRGRRFEVLPLPSFIDGDYRTDSLKFGLAADSRFGLLTASAYQNETQGALIYTSLNIKQHNQVFVLQGADLLKLGADHTIRLDLEYRHNSLGGAAYGGEIGYGAYAAGAMWNWQITPDIAMTNAVRFDHLMLSYTAVPVAGIRYTIADYNDARLSAISFNSGLVYKPTSNDTFRLLAARGVQAPSLVDFGLQTTNVLGGVPVSFIGNPTLDAASVTNYEFDYDRTLSTINAVLRTAIYYQRTDDLLTSALNAPLGYGAGGLVSYAQNIGSSTAAGGEIGLKGTSDAGIRWNASYSYISIADHFTLGMLSGFSGVLDYQHGSPASVIDIGAGYSWGRFEVDAKARWQSHFTDYVPTPDESAVPLRIDDYVTANARIGYHVTDNVTLALAGEQLTQAQILEAAGTPVERRITASITVQY